MTLTKPSDLGESKWFFFPGCDIEAKDWKFYFVLEQWDIVTKVELNPSQYEALKKAKIQEKKEVEWKYLINVIPDSLSSSEHFYIEQAYLYAWDKDEVRVRKKEWTAITYTLTIKSWNWITRWEYEVEISKDQYDALRPFHIWKVIKKTRFEVIEWDSKIEVDIYSDWNNVAEVEFDSEEQKVVFEQSIPYWIWADVTFDKRLKNKNLALKWFPEIYTEQVRKAVLEKVELILGKK
jgi:CYTH domain-containing protein